MDEIHLYFPVEDKDVRSIAPLKLAYLGDAVFEIIIRTLILDTTGGPVKNLHTKTSSLVNAASQAALAAAMQEKLTEDEAAVFRHGRNAKTSSVAKHADIRDYRNATGLEALFGYFYLTNQTKRAIELLKYAMEKTKGD
jgi:ribonuclease-3 family protein